MTDQPNTSPFVHRIRGKNGPQAGKWLWMMTVSKGGSPFQVINWPNVVRNANQYQFHPQFLNEESSATRVSLDTAQAYIVALKTLGIDAEIVQGDVNTQSVGMDEITAQNVFLGNVRARLDEAVKAGGDVVKLKTLLQSIAAIAFAHSEIEDHRQAPNSPPTPFQRRIADVLATASLNVKAEPVLMDLQQRLDHIRKVLSAVPVQ